MANITDSAQESPGWGFGQLVTSPSIGLVVSVGSNIVIHTVLNELHEILKTILTGNVSVIFTLRLTVVFWKKRFVTMMHTSVNGWHIMMAQYFASTTLWPHLSWDWSQPSGLTTLTSSPIASITSSGRRPPPSLEITWRWFLLSDTICRWRRKNARLKTWP